MDSVRLAYMDEMTEKLTKMRVLIEGALAMEEFGYRKENENADKRWCQWIVYNTIASALYDFRILLDEIQRATWDEIEGKGCEAED